MPINPKIDWDTDDSITHTDMNRIETNTIINENAITDNAANIGTNTTAIANNATTITANTLLITTNLASINALDNQYQISDHAGTIATIATAAELSMSRLFERVGVDEKLTLKSAKYRFNDSDLRLRISWSGTPVWTSADAANKTDIDTTIFENTTTDPITGTMDILVYNSAGAGSDDTAANDSWWVLFEMEDT